MAVLFNFQVESLEDLVGLETLLPCFFLDRLNQLEDLLVDQLKAGFHAHVLWGFIDEILGYLQQVAGAPHLKFY